MLCTSHARRRRLTRTGRLHRHCTSQRTQQAAARFEQNRARLRRMPEHMNNYRHARSVNSLVLVVLKPVGLRVHDIIPARHPTLVCCDWNLHDQIQPLHRSSLLRRLRSAQIDSTEQACDCGPMSIGRHFPVPLSHLFQSPCFLWINRAFSPTEQGMDGFAIMTRWHRTSPISGDRAHDIRETCTCTQARLPTGPRRKRKRKELPCTLSTSIRCRSVVRRMNRHVVA
jgi:hypothetical protein